MTAPFASDAESLAAARAAARAAAATAAAAASADAAAAAAAQSAPDDSLHEDNDRLEIVNTKQTVMDDPIVSVDTDAVVAAAADPHAHHSDVDRRKPEDAHDATDSDGVAVPNGESESVAVPLHVVVTPHDATVDDRRDPSDVRVVDSGSGIPVSVAPDHHHQNALAEPQHALDAPVDDVAMTTSAAQETESHQHITELLPAPTTASLPPPPPIIQPLQTPAKKKRKTYSTEEERRKARILKNRRTAEESRQRRMKRMKELEEYAARASAREKELQEEVRMAKEQLQEVTESLRNIVEEKNTEIADRDAEIQRLQEKLTMKQ